MAEAMAEPPITILPKEVMIEILSRLDASNLLQLRCVCKLWNSLVVDRQVLKNHINKLFDEITVLLYKAEEHVNLHPVVPQEEDVEDVAEEEDEEEVEENEEEEKEEEEDAEEEGAEEEENEEEEEDTDQFMVAVAQLNNVVMLVPSLKDNLLVRLKGIKAFLRITLKSLKSSSSSSS
nr:Cyclin-like F-box [Medicago truncatula]